MSVKSIKNEKLKTREIIFTLAVLMAMLFSNVAFSQRQKIENLPVYEYKAYHFGFILAGNDLDFRLKPVSNLNSKMFSAEQTKDISADSARLLAVVPKSSPGFTVGIVGAKRVGKFFELRLVPSLTFGERYIDYTILKFRGKDDILTDVDTSLIDIRKDVQSTFIQFPLSIKYKSLRLNNFQAYILGGTTYLMDLASQANSDADQVQIEVKLYRNDISLDIGMGFDFYFEWFKMGLELKMNYGLFNMVKKEDNIYTGGIESLKSKIFQFSLTFE